MQQIAKVTFVLALRIPCLDAATLRSPAMQSLRSMRGSNSAFQEPVKAEPFSDLYTISETRCPHAYLPVACAKDTQMEQRRVYSDVVKKLDRAAMTPEVCFNFCKNITGSTFFGLQNGNECYCSPFFTEEPEASGDCDKPCEGDASQTCGGAEKSNMYEMHDCNNMPPLACKRPPNAVEHAVVFKSRYYRNGGSVCRNALTEALTTINSHCEVECEPGYELFKNTIKCVAKGNRLTLAWAQIEGSAICVPKDCGPPSDLPHSSHALTHVLFPDSVQYTCQQGYSLDAQAQGLKTQSAHCQTSGLLQIPAPCRAVVCGMCPRGEGVFLNALPAESTERVFQDTCGYQCKDGYTLDQQAGSLASFMTRCLASGNFSEPKECLRVTCGPPPNLPHATNLEHSDASQFYEDKINYTCDEGYSLTGLYSGEKKFGSVCQANGQFKPMPACLPVKCGAPPPVKNADFSESLLEYTQTVTYTCHMGYSLLGQAGAPIQKTIACGSNGQFEEAAPRCLPIECGKTPVFEHAALSQSDSGSVDVVNFETAYLMYKCEPGYSTLVSDDPYHPRSDNFHVSCMASGQFSEVPPCVNIEDCLVHSCGPNGRCVDGHAPKGVPLEDYSCECDAGYEVTLASSTTQIGELEKECTNINDCPLSSVCGGTNEQGNERGVCVDKLLGYDCTCSDGYLLGSLESNATCSPIPCGEVPIVSNATVSSVGEVNYDSKPLQYTCDVGHSLDGVATGEKSFTASCSVKGMFRGLQSCLAVTCGTLEPIANGYVNPEPLELLFPERVTYSCDEGFSLNGKADGQKNFELSCQADGTQTKLEQCLPVECGKVPLLTNADYDKDRVFTFQQEAQISCEIGYSVDQTNSIVAKTYKLTCLSSGKFTEPQVCKPISCGIPPVVEFTEKEVIEKVYPEKAEYNLILGYTLNGQVGGPNKFSILCLSDGSFANPEVPRPVECGLTPTLPNSVAGNTQKTYVFAEDSHYACQKGFSVDGKVSGAQNFSLSCMANGSFNGIEGCKPVECGAIVLPQRTNQEPDSDGRKLKELVFGTYAQLKCNPGYSLDGILRSSNIYPTIQCSPQGELIYPPPCINEDDCANRQNECSPNGRCVDHPEPTGDHSNDFHCDCDSGFAENISVDKENVRSCVNVPDCPQGACLPGSCSDLINDFECNCPEGYFDADGKHDCTPVSCGMPPSAAHAVAESSQQKETFFNSAAVKYVCNEGYTLDGTAAGINDYALSCLANKSFEVAASCLPVKCGAPPKVEDAAYPSGPFQYPDTVKYTCNSGHSTDALYGAVGSANTEFESRCLPNGTFSPASECKSLVCPGVPEQEYATSSHVGAQLVFQESLTVTCAAGYALNQDGKDTSYTIACNELAQLVYSSGTKRCAPVSCGVLPTVQHAAVEGGNLYGESFMVQCDPGFSTDQSTIPSRSTYSVACQSDGTFAATKPCLPILCGNAPVVDNTTHSPTDSCVFEEKVVYKLQEGFTLDGTPAGVKQFEIVCQDSGSFTATQTPQPVSCGVAPDRAFSSHPARTRVFMETEPYNCYEGYSLNGQADGDKQYDLTCLADGRFEPDASQKSCQPIKCGKIDSPSNSEQVIADRSAGLFSTLEFPQEAAFKCLKGYSLNGRLNGLLTFTRRCQADGVISSSPGCINMDDCEGHMCAPNGQCVDHASPTGEHLNDYHCKCDSGFNETVLADGSRLCGNIPDCPEGACLPGSCQDLVNDYSCTCPAGYFEGENQAQGLKHDCLPVSCGVPPEVQHGVTETKVEVVFDSPPVQYTCAEGYTLDGAPSGDKTFAISCLANFSFETPQVCQPVRCGQASQVDHAIFDSTRVLTYSDKVEYACAEGYSVDGRTDGAKAFEATCQANGHFQGVLQCQAVACAVEGVSFGPNATYSENAAATLVFPEQLQITCFSGYALNKDQHSLVSYSATCQANGTIDVPDVSCTAIDCGIKPVIEHGTVDGSTLFGGALVARAEPGYSVDGSSREDASTFTMNCMMDGVFSGKMSFQRVECGVVPIVAHATPSTPQTSRMLFSDMVTYTLETGYSVDGTVAGAKEFTVTCQANGTFSTLVTPMLISCGPPPTVQFGSVLGETTDRVFKETAVIGCDSGYSTDGTTKTSSRNFEVVCTDTGKYMGLKTCVPMQCGTVETPPHAVQIADGDGQKSSTLTFKQSAKYQCSPGFSRDGIVGSELLQFVATCEATGKIVYGDTCKNNDDCASPDGLNQCSPHGSCVDKPEPSGVHANDFTCSCESGFALTRLETNALSCENVPDCPEGACSPGSCTDLINDYACRCPNGYYESANAVKSLTHDCFPVSCGGPPKLSFAVTEQSTEVKFDMSPVIYHCIEGYSLDGTPLGMSEFSLRCLANESFSSPPPCLPISCGVAPVVQYSTHSSGELTFKKKVQYACDEGYTTTGVAGAPNSFEMVCSAQGSLVGTGPQECLAVKCPNAFKDAYATYNALDVSSAQFPDEQQIVCMPGYRVSNPQSMNRSYVTRCTASGTLVLVPTAVKCEPIDCLQSAGPVPTVQFALVTGSTFYGGVLTAKAYPGYFIDGVPEGISEFNFTCNSDGQYSPQQTFQPCTCLVGSSPANVASIQVNVVAMLQLDVGAGTGVNRRLRIPHARFKDNLTYQCSEGFHAAIGDTVDLEDPTNFTLTCNASGKLAKATQGLKSIVCVPIQCEVENLTDDNEFPILDEGARLPINVSFREQQRYQCRIGFSVDGSPAGETSFVKTCRANASLHPPKRTCKDIDWCPNSKCGEHGKCVDGVTNYTCQCEPGYEAYAVGNDVTCKEIDECITLGGTEKCGGNGGRGHCLDRLERYQCQCNEGYEVFTHFQATAESCEPVVCQDPVPDLPHSSAPSVGKKLAYKQVAYYGCDSGYTLDSIAGSSTAFQVTCQANRSFSGIRECKPVSCGALPARGNATTSSTSLVFGESAKFKCAEGFTTTGNRVAADQYSVSCTAAGQFTSFLDCLPVSCGLPPVVNRATAHLEPMAFGGKVTYSCATGSTVTGEAGGAASFEVTCDAKGELVGLAACNPISCGAPAAVPHSVMPITKLSFPDQFQGMCEAGYTVDGTTLGQTAFVGSCTINGSIIGVETCKPVSCGVPQPTNSSRGTSHSSGAVYGDVATWECLPGWSINGESDGGRTYQRQCLTSGEFGLSQPKDCKDINYCIGNPCGSNGVCNDVGPGVPFPGYNCTCYEGFESKLRGDGSSYCSADDCQGAPCGAGGTCTDLSKQGGADGAYACSCATGYELDQTNPDKPMCRRLVCGALPPTIQHALVSTATVNTWLQDAPMTDSFTNAYILRSFDSAVIQCETGYSTDGNAQNSMFSISCLGSGMFSRALNLALECQPVRCNNIMLPTVPNAVVLDSNSVGFYEYPAQVGFSCKEGFTIGGTVGGQTKFSLKCNERGNFPDALSLPSCSPVQCPVPTATRATASASGTVIFGKSVIFTCSVGYSVGSQATYTGTCGASGQLQWEAGGVQPTCDPVSCGAPPAQPNAAIYMTTVSSASTQGNSQGNAQGNGQGNVQSNSQGNGQGNGQSNDRGNSQGNRGTLLLLARGSRREGRANATAPSNYVAISAGTTVKFGNAPLYVQCLPGHKVSGSDAGSDNYALECGCDGRFNTVAATCAKVMYRVMGRVTDARSANIRLPDVTVVFKQGDTIVGSTTTNGASGVFQLDLPAGNYLASASKTGYISTTVPVEVKGLISVGQGADIALSEVLPAGTWRAVLEWSPRSRDLDSWTYFGQTKSTTVSYMRTNVLDSYTGIRVILDRDDVDGYGPETTTFTGVGSCVKTEAECKLFFKVNNYTPQDLAMGMSGGTVKVLQGDRTVAVFQLPTNIGTSTDYIVFTLFTKKDAVRVAAGSA